MTTAVAPAPAAAAPAVFTAPAANPAAATAELIEILETAANFGDHQWTQHTYGRNPDGTPALNFVKGEGVQFCADGHLLRAVERLCPRDFAMHPLYAALEPFLPEPADLVRWNDMPERQPAEVRELFRKAADRLRRLQ